MNSEFQELKQDDLLVYNGGEAVLGLYFGVIAIILTVCGMSYSVSYEVSYNKTYSDYLNAPTPCPAPPRPY